MLQLLKNLDRKAATVINNIDNALAEPTVKVLTLQVFAEGETPADTTRDRQSATESATAPQPKRKGQPTECIEGCYSERALA